MDSSYTLRTISDILHECQQLIFSVILNKSNYDTIAANNTAIAQRLALLEIDIVSIRDPTNTKQNQLVVASEKESVIITMITRIKNTLLSSQSVAPRMTVCAAYNCASTLRQRNGSNLITLSGLNTYVLSTSGSGAGSLTFESSDSSRIGVDTDFGSFLLNTTGFSFVSFEFSLYFESSDESILTGPSIGFGICITNTTTPTFLQVSRCKPTRTLFNNNAPGFSGGGRCMYKIQSGTTSISARIYVTNLLFTAKLFYGCGYVPFFRVRMY
jgi:hypothetical protein